MATPRSHRPRLKWFDAETGQRARKGITGPAYADIEDGSGRYERRGEEPYFTAVFVHGDGGEEILLADAARDTAYYACVRHYYG